MTVLAVVLALAGAAALAAGTALQQRVSQQVGDPDRTAALLRRVLQRPRWWIGQAVIVLGFSLYAAALACGPLLAVQPVLITGLVFGTMFSARLARRRLDRTLVGGSILCVVGLAVLLLAARPTSAATLETGAPATTPLILTAILGCLLGGIGLTRHSAARELPHALTLALGTVVFYGLTAVLVAPIMHTAAHEPATLVAWLPRCGAAAVTALAGWALSQRAFQLGRLLAPVNAVISITDPAVAVALGLAALGERLVLTVDTIALMITGIISIVAGVVLLSRRGARLVADLQRAPDEPARTVPRG